MVTGASTADLALVLDRRPQGRARAVAPPRGHRVAAAGAAPRAVRQQDGPRRLRRRSASTRSATSSPSSPPSSTSPTSRSSRSRRCTATTSSSTRRTCRGTRARRCCTTSSTCYIGVRPQPDRRAVPGAVRDPADERTSTTTTAATPARSPAACSGPATRSSCCRRGFTTTIAGDRHVRRPDRGGRPADVGHDPPRRRHRHQPRRHDLPAAQPADGQPGHRRDGVLVQRAAAARRRRRTRSSTRRARRGRWCRTCSTGSTSTRCTATRTAGALALNEIGRVTLRTTAPLFVDEYRRNRTTGSFILIDEATNETVGAGMILGDAASP